MRNAIKFFAAKPIKLSEQTSCFIGHYNMNIHGSSQAQLKVHAWQHYINKIV